MRRGRGIFKRLKRAIQIWSRRGSVISRRTAPHVTARMVREESAGRTLSLLIMPADDPPMTCPRLDHYGFSVGTEAELDAMLERAKAFQAKDPRVDIIDKHVDDHGVLAITSIYVGYLLPMMIEIQWWDFKGAEPRSAGATA